MVDTVDSKSAAGTRREGSIPSSPTYQPPFSGEVIFAMAAGHPQAYRPTLTIARLRGIGTTTCREAIANLVKALYVEIGAGGYLYGSLAQLVEHRTFNPRVVGSTPTRPTF